MRNSPAAADFRQAAVAASEAILAQQGVTPGGPADPVEAGVSYCIPAEGDGRAALRTLKWRVIVGLALGMAGLAGGAFLAVRAEKNPDASTRLLTLGTVCSASGMLLLFYGATVQRRLVRKVARDRITVPREGASKPLVVSIEDGRTYEKMKAVPEDVGAVILHPGSHCVQIEGLTHRYMIYADDVDEMTVKKTPNSQALVLRYRVGKASLHLALFYNGLGAELKRQTVGGRNRGLEQIRATLEVEPIEPISAE